MKNLYQVKQKTVENLNNIQTLDANKLFDVELNKLKLFDGSIELQLILKFRNKKSILLGTYNQGNWFITLDGHCNEYLTFTQVRLQYGDYIASKMRRLLTEEPSEDFSLKRNIKTHLKILLRQWHLN